MLIRFMKSTIRSMCRYMTQVMSRRKRRLDWRHRQQSTQSEQIVISLDYWYALTKMDTSAVDSVFLFGYLLEWDNAWGFVQ